MNGGFGDDIGVEAVTQVNGVDIVTIVDQKSVNGNGWCVWHGPEQTTKGKKKKVGFLLLYA